MALVAGFILAYPLNWWLVAKGLKHGMITVRPGKPRSGHGKHPAAGGASMAAKAGMTVFTIACLVVGIALVNWLNR